MTVSYKKVSEATVQKQIAADADDFDSKPGAKTQSFAEALPELAANMRRSLGGRSKSDNPKRAVSLRLDPEVIENSRLLAPAGSLG